MTIQNTGKFWNRTSTFTEKTREKLAKKYLETRVYTGVDTKTTKEH